MSVRPALRPAKWIAPISNILIPGIKFVKIQDLTLVGFSNLSKFKIYPVKFVQRSAKRFSHGPSVIQTRTQDTAPKAIAHIVLSALTHFEESLSEGAIVTIDEKRARARILPLGGRD